MKHCHNHPNNSNKIKVPLYINTSSNSNFNHSFFLPKTHPNSSILIMSTLAKITSLSYPRGRIFFNGPIIVGSGPSGLAVAACLRDKGVPFLVLEKSNCIASLWQTRTYDRLKLHLTKHFCQLPKLPFPDHFPKYPSKKQFILYLESYAKHFNINPTFNETVLSAQYNKASGFWQVRSVNTGGVKEAEGILEHEYICRWLVVATGENAEMVIPEFDGLSSFDGRVIHTSEYKSGKEYHGQRVLVVGCGNSAMEVCLDLCHHNAIPFMVLRNSVRNLQPKFIRYLEKQYISKYKYVSMIGSCFTEGNVRQIDI